MIDLRPAANRMSELIAATADEDLDRPTPAPDLSVATLVDHVGTFARVFQAVATKDLANAARPGAPSASNLEPGWRDRMVADLGRLVDAWDDPAAWTGDTSAGGVPLTGDQAGLVALDELVVHAWDLAVATDRPYEADPGDVQAAAEWIIAFDPPRDGSLFGPVVPVDDDAPGLDRLLGLAGRDPRWRPPA
jgi:uncharacterized protein (TIGR03086 family)